MKNDYPKTDYYESIHVSNPSKPYIFHPARSGQYFMSHWHENVELLWFHAASRVICDREQYDVSPGDIAIFGSNSLHSIPESVSTVYDCLIIDSRFLSFNSIDTLHLRFDCVVRDERASELYSRVIDEITRSRDFPDFADAGVKSAILALMVALCRGFAHPSGEHETGGIVRSAIGYINSHLTKQMTVDEIADSVKVSKYYFCREFRRETGYTVVKYINNLRCRDAERLLRSGQYTVGEVAHTCGYDNLSYFTRTFKSITGRTPSELRGETEK